MATGPGFPGATNVYIPNWEASGQLMTGFSRNVKRFHLPRYVQYIRSPKIRGYWLKYTNQDQDRVIDQNRYIWPYGHPRPVPLEHESFNWNEFNIKRYDYPYGLDQKTIDQADFNVLQVERENKATKLMTARTIRCLTVLTTAANWQTTADPDLSADHTATATSLAGGKLDVGTSTAPYIMKAFNAVQNLITKDTGASIENEPGRFFAVVSPTTAALMAASPEMHDYIKSSPTAYAEITGGLHPNTRFGLPETVYGVEIIVETAVKVTSEALATVARSYIMPDNEVLFMSRQGSLEGVYGERSFSTFVMFYGADKNVAGDIVVEEYTDARNKMIDGHCSEETAEVLTCPASGYLITAATG